MTVIKVKGTQVDIVDISADVAADATAIGSIATGIVADAGSKATFDAEWLTGVLADTTPQLGGNLDTNGNNIVTAAAVGITNDINILPGASSGNDGGNVNLTGGSGYGGAGSSDGGDINITGGSGGYQGGKINIISGVADYTGDYCYSGDITVKAANGGSATAYAGNISIGAGTAGVGSDYDGGDVTIFAGLGDLTGNGGKVSITAGFGGQLGLGGVGGELSLYSGSGRFLNNAGPLNIKGGRGGATGGDGGPVTITGGFPAGNNVGGSSGLVTLQGGEEPFFNNLSTGGSILIKAGAGGNTSGDAGNITLQAGATVGSGSPGSVILPNQTAPTVTTNKLYAIAGALTWNGTDLTAPSGLQNVVEDITPQLGGTLDVNAFSIVGDTVVGNDASGGDVKIYGGDTSGDTTLGYYGGAVNIKGGYNAYIPAADDESSGGPINITGGDGNGYGGEVNITGGLNPSGSYYGGEVSIAGGKGNVGGNADVRGAAGNASYAPGDAVVRGGFTGVGGTSTAGTATIGGGFGRDAQAGGNVEVLGGNAQSFGASSTGIGGQVQIRSGNGGGGGVGGDPGDISIEGGVGLIGNHDGGDIIITPGAGIGTGTDGAVVVSPTTAPLVTTDKLYNVAGELTFNGAPLVTNPTATTAELIAIANAINTSALKVAGYMVFNTTTAAPVWAVGSADGSVWNDATGTLAHTPV